MNVITNNKPRMLLMWAELPPGVGNAEFDYVGDADRYEPRFFNYHGAWYDIFEFDYISDQPCDAPFRGKWDGVQTTSYFTGVVIRWRQEFESVVVGRYYV